MHALRVNPPTSTVAILGAGPAALMAAEVIATAGLPVTVFERMPSPGRKLLMAGRGGLNLTHAEDFDSFVANYGAAADWMRPHLAAFPPAAAIAWCESLGQPTFVGTSGRVFPRAMKASPLLRAWLRRLDGLSVRLVTRAHWTGWNADGALTFADGSTVNATATVLALGGASWPRLGADGSWMSLLPDVATAPLRPANCGFTVAWSDVLRTRHAGAPLKRIALSFGDATVRGEAVVTATGIEGGAIYALSAALRDAIARNGGARVHLDLRPDLQHVDLARKLAVPRGSASLSTFLRKQAGLAPVGVALVQEALHAGYDVTVPLATLIKSLPLRLAAPFAIDRAISTAGGIALSELDANLMLRNRPGTFAAGEMLDWEAPTGGYLLQGCLATGAAAGRGVLAWLAEQPR